MHFNEASEWRIDLTREIVNRFYTHRDIVMVVLGGSPTKNMADSVIAEHELKPR